MAWARSIIWFLRGECPMHEWLKTALAFVNTGILVAGAIVAYREFVGRTGESATQRAEETYNRIEPIVSEVGFFFEYYLVKDLGDYSERIIKDNEFNEKFDKALAFYFTIGKCMDFGACDAHVIDEILCPSVLMDGQVMNRTAAKAVQQGGLFVDRTRIWKFYELLEHCLSVSDPGPFGHVEFLARFGDDINFLERVDAAMFERLKAGGVDVGPLPITPEP